MDRRIFSIILITALLVSGPNAHGWNWRTSAEARAGAESARGRSKALEGRLAGARQRTQEAAAALNRFVARGADTADLEALAGRLKQRISQTLAQKDKALDEYRRGEFCTGCSRTRSDILANDSPPAVFPHSGQQVRAATPEEIARKAREFDNLLVAAQRELDRTLGQIQDRKAQFEREAQSLATALRQAQDTERLIQQEIAQADMEAQMAASAEGFLAGEEARKAAMDQQRAMEQARMKAAADARKAQEAERKAREAERLARQKLEAEARRIAQEQSAKAEQHRREAEARATEARELATQKRDAEAADRWENVREARQAQNRALAELAMAEQMRRSAYEPVQPPITPPTPSVEPSPGTPPPTELSQAKQQYDAAHDAREQAERNARDAVQQEQQGRREFNDSLHQDGQEGRQKLESVYEQYRDQTVGSPLSPAARPELDLRGSTLDALAQTSSPDAPGSLADGVSDRISRAAQRAEGLVERLQAAKKDFGDTIKELPERLPERLLDKALEYGPSSPADRLHEGVHSLLSGGESEHPNLAQGLMNNIVTKAADRWIEKAEDAAGKVVATQVLGLSSGGSGNAALDKLDEEMVVNSNAVNLAYKTGFVSLSGLKEWMTQKVDIMGRMLDVAGKDVGLVQSDE